MSKPGALLVSMHLSISRGSSSEKLSPSTSLDPDYFLCLVRCKVQCSFSSKFLAHHPVALVLVASLLNYVNNSGYLVAILKNLCFNLCILSGVPQSPLSTSNLIMICFAGYTF